MDADNDISAADGEIDSDFIEDVCDRLANNKPVKRQLPGGGRLNIDRLLPFLCVYRRDPRRTDAGTELFVQAEAAYASLPGNATIRKGLSALVRGIAHTAAQRLGGFLIVEIWTAADADVPQSSDPRTGELQLPPAGFRILAPMPHRPERTCATLGYELQRIRIHRRKASSQFDWHAEDDPRAARPLISEEDAQEINCHVLGLEISPIFRDRRTGEPYSDVLRVLRRGVGRALKKAFFAFSLDETNVRPQHYFALGRKSLPKLAWEVDRELANVSSQFKFLLQVTPINAERSWHEFRDSDFRAAPEFEYRPLDSDPLLLKRELWQIRTEQIEDPALSHILRQTQDELDRQITMLADLRTSRFLPGSLQVFGGIEPDLLALAETILNSATDATDGDNAQINATDFLALANDELRHYREQSPNFAAQAIISEDMYSGLLCSGGNLLIGRELSIPARRANALLQHEIGTHLVTYHNGGQQPLGLLRVGLAGYDGLQEGLAVLSEYLVGGLSAARLRLLAARVIAAHDLVAGATFAETFRRLTEEFRVEARPAYTVTLRVFRGGGLTKDAVYLRGLSQVLAFVQGGGRLEPLFVGKIAIDHMPIIKELRYRNVLKPIPLMPRYLYDANAMDRLEELRNSQGSVGDLVGQLTNQNGSGK